MAARLNMAVRGSLRESVRSWRWASWRESMAEMSRKTSTAPMTLPCVSWRGAMCDSTGIRWPFFLWTWPFQVPGMELSRTICMPCG